MKRYLVIAFPFAIVLAIYGLDHGIYIGSTTYTTETIFIHKICRYLFVTGVSELPARGGSFDEAPMYRGVRLSRQPDSLYCRFFRD